MKDVEFWQWMVWDLHGTKMHKTRHRMDEVTALSRHPEAVRVPGSMIMQRVCETEEDRMSIMNTRPLPRKTVE